MSTKSQAGREHQRGPDKGEAYGVAAVTQALAGIDFPASKKEILQQAKGHEEIHWTKDKTIDLRSLLDQTGQDRFESMPELVEAISQRSREEELS
ncbi:DUF2795 domain-containing protein [Anabaena cylindrica FACHB-243]|uniref:DUF2795 domain-containing protein n=1 Tax=Anabaena cylindrica (strain ATCC 27899 / PCC 7122) TaxID=272123 RepID=K9ZD17_ANACC|nr:MULTISPECIES: DUF2795 domain-containing protein [Anabaena]AFZ56245.1 hypothetical protein Anacy_0654 [Anabaena cylindrica PCC 7122]MBD2417472.1 DUF2795 domain-containing protein [Anabaena cylindrica FACHB-243]MBY5285625.1 DUF2795 domain-containing protein [Anabaena sp. CCAP 1446/1C]MBY5310965.1 DUF2795 domain-containing protein [Anabaena sp. CCAP 1446/1C]MCM2407642.1 DUF2795 domain-containing protein [Anabaena sp. CCAP 1446/1C]